jgi:hypothetical protein
MEMVLDLLSQPVKQKLLLAMASVLLVSERNR